MSNRLRKLIGWIRRLFKTEYEKACGCSYLVSGGFLSDKYAPETTELDSELAVVSEKEFTNCTRRENEWRRHLRCENCGAEWVSTESAGRSIDYGDENEDADARLKLKSMRPSPLGGYVTNYEEVPDVKRGG